MSGLALFRRKDQPQSLVKAPSADLIKPDTAPELPKMVEIGCELSPEELAKYVAAIGNTEFLNIKFERELLCHLLKSMGCKQYAHQNIESFLDKLRIYLGKKEGRTIYLHPSSSPYKTYEGFLPPRIINRITEIRNKFVHSSEVSFDITHFWAVYSTGRDIEEKVDICFLKVRILNSNESLIIDAWRGPTFSDEEAKI